MSETVVVVVGASQLCSCRGKHTLHNVGAVRQAAATRGPNPRLAQLRAQNSAG